MRDFLVGFVGAAVVVSDALYKAWMIYKIAVLVIVVIRTFPTS